MPVAPAHVLCLLWFMRCCRHKPVHPLNRADKILKMNPLWPIGYVEASAGEIRAVFPRHPSSSSSSSFTFSPSLPSPCLLFLLPSRWCQKRTCHELPLEVACCCCHSVNVLTPRLCKYFIVILKNAWRDRSVFSRLEILMYSLCSSFSSGWVVTFRASAAEGDDTLGVSRFVRLALCARCCQPRFWDDSIIFRSEEIILGYCNTNERLNIRLGQLHVNAIYSIWALVPLCFSWIFLL